MSWRHRDILEAELHEPKGFTTANNGDSIWRNEQGLGEWTDREVLPAALNFVDASVAPPTTASGDIYVLSLGASIHANWGTVALKDWVRYDGVAWKVITPSKSILCYDKTEDALMSYDGSLWATIGGDSIYTDSGVVPSSTVATITDSLEFSGGRLNLSSITDGFLLPRLTAAQRDAVNTPTTNLIILNTDTNSFEKYNGSVWVSANLAKYTLKSGGINKPYSSFYTAVNDAVNDDVIEVNVSESVNCGLGNGSWNWSSNISINLKGHKIELTNLSRVSLADNIDLSITGGGVFTMTHGSQSIFNSNGNATFTSDGSVIMYSKGGVFKQLSNDATKTFIINNVRQTIKDNNRYFIYNSTTDGKIVANNCYGEMDNVTNSDATLFYGKNIVINNGIFIGRIYFSGGGNVLSEQSTIFNNCSIDSDGQGVFGDIAVKINNCNIKCNNAQILSNGNIIAKNSSLLHTGTGTYALTTRGYSNFYNCTIESSTSGIYFLIFGGTTNSNIENCKITALNGTGIVKYSTPLLVLVVVKNSIIESTGGNCIVATQSNKGLLIDLSDSTLICNTNGLFCIGASSGTFARYNNLKMKNTADAADILNRAALATENPQSSTVDTIGNIILD
tara:strand:- start:466 stop:2325 length:1860 start_codon:yes stop_codon:yes gene_type:complete